MKRPLSPSLAWSATMPASRNGFRQVGGRLQIVFDNQNLHAADITRRPVFRQGSKLGNRCVWRSLPSPMNASDAKEPRVKVSARSLSLRWLDQPWFSTGSATKRLPSFDWIWNSARVRPSFFAWFRP
jgi:hypothetical protein